ncbi:MAG: hypothetical protein KDI30_00455 [Pseudomonadales bacterium]|nr:hypothetical protein [Pseudomonadales bacterium]
MENTPSSRRHFLKQFSFATAALAGYHPLAAMCGSRPAGLSGQIYGISSKQLSPAQNQKGNGSTLIHLDLNKGFTRYHLLPDYHSGHSLIEIDPDNFYCTPYSGKQPSPCLFLDSAFNITARIDAPEGFAFGGHSALLPDGKTIFGCFNPTNRFKQNTGIAYLVDTATKKLVKTFNTPLLHAHDMIVSIDQQHIIVSDDGTVEGPIDSNSPFSEIIQDPAVYFFNCNTLEIDKKVQHGHNGSFVHIDQDQDGSIYGAIEQFIYADAKPELYLEPLLHEKTAAYIASYNKGGEIPLPSPMVRISASDKRAESISAQLEYHTNPFDIKFNTNSGYLVNVFVDSNTLVRYNPRNGKSDYFSTTDYGISKPFGLANLGNTSLMALSGFDRGIAVFDTNDMSYVTCFSQENHGLRHMIFKA